MKFKSIRTRVFVTVVPVMALTFVPFAALNYFVAGSRIDAVFNEKMYEGLHRAELGVQLELYKNAAVAGNLANYAGALEKNTFSHETNGKRLAERVGANRNTIGGGVWFEPYGFDPAALRFGTYSRRDSTGKALYYADYGKAVDYFTAGWYLKGKASDGEPAWSEARRDPYSGAAVVTVAVPFFDGGGKFAGIGTADMDVVDIRGIVNGIRVGNTGRAFVIGAEGEYITFLGEGKDVSGTIQNDPEASLARLGAEIMARSSGMTTLARGGVNYRVYYSTIEGVDWTMAVLVDEREINSAALRSFAFATLIPVAGLLLITACIYLFVNYLRRIIDKVNDFADLAASGDFSKRVEVTETDEFGVMEQRLNAMIESMDAMSRHAAELLSAAESANRSKSDFLSRMSHEIRSPMNAIIGMTQIAKAAASPEKVDDCLMKIDNASKHLLALINDVLDMSKIEANKFELACEEFCLETALNKIYDMMSVKAEEKKQRLTLSVDKNLPEYVVSDELRFSQVVTNLVSNAIKFTGENGRIDVCARSAGAGGAGGAHIVRVDVRDTGIGLDSDQIDKLFKPFEQGDGSVSRKFGGTGLGLAINKRIVEMMEGEIWVESEAGKGSVFSFTARMREGSGAQADAKGRRGGRRQRAIQAKDMRILAVDDSEEANEYTAHVLSALGFTCELAHDGGEAVEAAVRAAADNRPFDVIFMDYMMPKMSGIEAAKKIRDATNENVSIVMVSMYDWKEFEQKAREAGIVKCVSKPISPSTALDSISEALPSCVIRNDGAEVAAPKVGFSGNTILLAEDIDINREIIAAFLEDTRVNIDFAVNGAEAVEKFRANPDRYDVILMDIQMPEMDGFEATRRIRAMDIRKAKTVPIVAMTANALSEDVQRCKEAGMNDHMAKPVDPEALVFKLNDLFFMKDYRDKNIW